MTTEFEQNLLEDLRLIGLEDKESMVYLACLELGPSSVLEIAKRSGIKRPTCYLLLDNLVAKRIAYKVMDHKRTNYAVSAPKEILAMFEKRKERFAEKLSQFQALASKSLEKPKIRMHEGSEGIERVYESTLDQPAGGEVLIYGTATVLHKYGDFIERYLARRVNRGIKARVIMADTEENRAITARDKEELRVTKFLPADKFSQSTEVNIYLDCIAYIAHSESEPFATVIESSRLAREEKERFELLWEIAAQ